MIQQEQAAVSRRAFLGRGGTLAVGALACAADVSVLGASPITEAIYGQFPRRNLGKTGQSVSALAFGTSPLGKSKANSSRQIAHLVDEALNLGIDFIDTARLDGHAEEGVGLALAGRRSEVFLATKVWADTITDAEASFHASLAALHTDYVDLLSFHNLGTCRPEVAMEPEGVFNWLVKQKQTGKTRFVGIAGSNLSERFPPFLHSGEVDVVMMPLNFVDRFIYRFENTVLPLARRLDLGVVATKVFGGARTGFRGYVDASASPQMPRMYLDLAIRYALGLPGVTTVNIGSTDMAQLRRNVAMVRNFHPLNTDQQSQLAGIGRRLAVTWASHFGPAAKIEV